MRKAGLLIIASLAPLAGGAVSARLSGCGPFSDVSPAYCTFVSELVYLGIAAGTSATTFSPDQPFTRGQAAVFVAKGIDVSIQRSSKRAALGQLGIPFPRFDTGMGVTLVGDDPGLLQSDGTDVWVANRGDGTVSRVRASDGASLGTWTGATGAYGVLIAEGRVFVTGNLSPGALYMIDPASPPGAVTVISSNLGNGSRGIAFDGGRIWVANSGDGTSGGSVSIVSPNASMPWPVTTISAGLTAPAGIVFAEGAIWVTEPGEGALKRLNGGALVNLTVPVGVGALFPVYDGTNIWVPSSAGADVVRASTGTYVTTVAGGDLNQPISVAFDGERILLINGSGPLPRAVFVNAANLSLIVSVPTVTQPPIAHPFGVCSDGTHFWISFAGTPGRVGKV